MELLGLRLDNPFDGNISNVWIYAKNMLLGKGFQQLETEHGFGLFYQFADANETIIQILPIPDGHIIFTYNTSSQTTFIKLLKYNGNIYTIFSSTYYKIPILESLTVNIPYKLELSFVSLLYLLFKSGINVVSNFIRLYRSSGSSFTMIQSSVQPLSQPYNLQS